MFKKSKNSESRKLGKKYNKLMKQAYNLSKTDRKLADAKYAEADEIKSRLESLV